MLNMNGILTNCKHVNYARAKYHANIDFTEQDIAEKI